MTMYGNFIFLVFLSLLISINGQSADDRNYPIARLLTGRTSKTSFDTEFSQGRCPRRFYQLGDECLYLGTDGKDYAWKNAERICARRIARLLDEPSAANPDQPNMQPTKGVRQLVLNTPEKTELLRAIYRDYNEHNFAVRLPFDYNTLQRCHDGKDDKWPHYCSDSQHSNSTCFETVIHGSNDVCLHGVECNKRHLRLACEFTLPGSAELIDSKFRTCAHGRHRRRLPLWALILIIVGSALLVLIIIAVIVGCILKSRKSGGSNKKFMPEPRLPEDKTTRVQIKRQDPATQPMIPPRTTASNMSEGYLTPTDNTANA